MRWLIQQETLRELRAARAGLVPTAEHRAQFAAQRRPAASSDNPAYTVAGNVAEIAVEGILTPQPDFWCWMLGLANTAYTDIQEAFALAAADPTVTSVVLRVNSPGGYVDGLFETLATIEAFKKPMSVRASLACSAAYAIAALAGQITATGAAAEFGSVGVACSFVFDADEEIVDVTSSEAPDKRPDPRTPEGKAVVVKFLDSLHELFVDAIARGRGTSSAVVNQRYGRGASMLAAQAKAAGMIDSIGTAGGSANGSAARPTVPTPQEVAAAALYDKPKSGETLTQFAQRVLAGFKTPAPAAPAGDAGDQLVALLAARGLKFSAAEPAHAPAPADPNADMGDKVADIFSARREGRSSPYSRPAAAFELPAGKDAGDLVADRICGRPSQEDELADRIADRISARSTALRAESSVTP